MSTTILDRIIFDKKREVLLKKKIIPASQLESSILMDRQSSSMSFSLRNNNFGIIAEHKRRSPSKAIINQKLSVDQVVKDYDSAKVSGISILTDSKYFGGSIDDLILARASTNKPLLRKDFILDTYQLIEAKAFGADVILLIAAILKPTEIKSLAEEAHRLGLEVLLEIHNDIELQKSLTPNIDIVGVNNRNLNNFEVNLETSLNLASKIPNEITKISESGISSVSSILKLRDVGYSGFLIGETFMKTETPGESAKLFINQLQKA